MGTCITCKFGRCTEDEVACSNREVMRRQSPLGWETDADHVDLIRIEVISDGTATCEFWAPADTK